ncbi:MAG: restriction endonuclease [Sedimentisphaerales bacterium]|nr:restriction endonuclease [Sedimentisphaerales bacterium]
MGWRDRKREELIKRYHDKSSVGTLTDIQNFVFQLYQNKTTTFQISTVIFSEPVLLCSEKSYYMPIEIPVQEYSKVSLALQATLYHPAPLIDDNAEVSVVNFYEFPVKISRYSFRGIRKEKTLFTPDKEPPTVKRRLKQVKRPPRPPSFHDATLEERLRWILTPPIHEVLSDPQLALPARPFPFQTSGIKWLYDRENALLADEMGLGKTMQAIIAARLLWRDETVNQILIICPKTLIATWLAEIRKWWPQVTSNVMVADSNRQFFLRLGTPNVVIKIINYEAICREAEWLEEQQFSHDLIIIDEAQRIKNPNLTSRAVKALNSHRRWALTGTPLENKIEDLVSILDFVRPGLIPNYKNRPSTKTRYVVSDDYIKSAIKPYILRRRAEEVLDELPEKSEQDIPIDIDVAQRETYDRMEVEGVLELNEKGESITVTHVFALINRLRQICNFDPVTGSSAKLEQLLEDLEEVSESGRKALIFSQFVEDVYGLKRLAMELEKAGRRVLQLHGQIPQNRRDGIIQTFQSDSDLTALLLNFKVGGVGLNLQAANYVFLFDRWWNPAVEDQAVKRVHRIGQTQKVFIRRFYCKDTIEERILKKLEEKRRLFRNVIDEARPEPDSMGLTEEEIFSLFNITVRPRKSSQEPQHAPVITENMADMDPTQFEVMVAQVYEKQGYTVYHTGGSHDEGIDILAEKNNAGARERIVIQCKRWKDNVGRPEVQQLWGVLSSDPSYTRGDLVTSSGFSAEARQFASGKRLGLIGGDLLSKLVREYGVAHLGQP